MTLFCSTPSNGFQTPHSSSPSTGGSALGNPQTSHISPAVLSHAVMDPHGIPSVSWRCQPHCHLRAFVSPVPSAYYAFFPVFHTWLFLNILSLDIIFSERSLLTHNAKQLAHVQPGCSCLFVHLFIFILNTLHISTYAAKIPKFFQNCISTVTLSDKNINANHKYKALGWLAFFYKVK